MARIRDNHLLINSALILFIYWVSGSMMPKPNLSVINYALLMIASCLGLWQYGPTAYKILFHGMRSNDELGRGEGSYLAIYGIFLVFLGAFVTSSTGMTWIAYGQPGDWIGSVYMNFGRFLTVCGFCCMSASPNFTKSGFVFSDRIWILIAALAWVIAAGIWIEKQVDPIDVDTVPYALSRANRPPCPADHPVWGSSTKTYHPPESPYRGMVIPGWCFKTAAEAEQAGFKSAR